MHGRPESQVWANQNRNDPSSISRKNGVDELHQRRHRHRVTEFARGSLSTVDDLNRVQMFTAREPIGKQINRQLLATERRME
jgi:hypothetical protein